MERLVADNRRARVWLIFHGHAIPWPRPYLQRMGDSLIVGLRFSSKWRDPVFGVDIELRRPRG